MSPLLLNLIQLPFRLLCVLTAALFLACLWTFGHVSRDHVALQAVEDFAFFDGLWDFILRGNPHE